MSRRRKRNPGDPRRLSGKVVTGHRIQFEAKHKHGAQLPDPVPGVHYWTTLAMFAVAYPAAQQQIMDLENLLTVEGPGCFWCGAGWGTPEADAPCPGDVLR